ncbi:DNA cytosine methyltransferase [Mycobacteroides salmoniphilum]|nr:DNA cytosine methyltransferase [Mycobacteroides salmoniphilum]
MAISVSESVETDRRFLSLFSGAGGLDLGLEAAGWEPIGAVEMDIDAVGTLELAARRRSKVSDAPEPLIYPKKIEDLPPGQLRRSLRMRKGELVLLAGGPPCQPFTTHGLRKSIVDSRAAGVWPAYLAYVDEFRPKALIIENVDGLLSAALKHRPLALRGNAKIAEDPQERKGSFLLWLLKELAARGYSVTWGLAEAADYGVPQFRQRSILIGVRGNVPCFLPPRQYGGESQPAYRTLREALATVTDLGAVQPLSQRKRSIYSHIPPGGNWRDLSETMQRESMGRAHLASGGKSGWWRRLAWDAPAPTILGMPDHSSTALVHPEETRCLSVAECAAAQSFPADVEFAGSPRSQYQQIGNAVPPLLGQAVGDQLLQHFRGVKQGTPPVPDWRKASANRRIGTHGWVLGARGRKPRLTLNVKTRDDHVWADMSREDTFELTHRAV